MTEEREKEILLKAFPLCELYLMSFIIKNAYITNFGEEERIAHETFLKSIEMTNEEYEEIMNKYNLIGIDYKKYNRFHGGKS